MKKNIITLIGGASSTFAPKVFRDIANFPEMEGCELRLVDIDEERLASYEKVARHVFESRGRQVTVKADTDRRAMLEGADYVLVAVEVKHYELWKQDFRIPVELGARQITGELGGPGGFFHSLRQIPIHLDIAQDAAVACPDAPILVMSNPLHKLCIAMDRYADTGQIIGLCHGVEMGIHFYLAPILEMDGHRIETTAAGTNHFTWILEMWDKETGEDLYPRFWEQTKKFPNHSPFVQRMAEIFGYLPGCDESHFGEYLPFAWDSNSKSGPDFQTRYKKAKEEAIEFNHYIRHAAGEKDGVDLEAVKRIDQQFGAPRSWADTLCIPIIAAQRGCRPHRMPAVNLRNDGIISNLQSDAFVEMPGIVSPLNVRGLHIGEMPEKLAALNRRELEVAEMTVEAAVSGDRKIALQAMMLDPTVHSIDVTEAVLDRMLKEQKDYLPQFQ